MIAYRLILFSLHFLFSPNVSFLSIQNFPGDFAVFQSDISLDFTSAESPQKIGLPVILTFIIVLFRTKKTA